MHNTRTRRNHKCVTESRRSPLKKSKSLLVPLKFKLHICPNSIF
uniref:Aconitate hydratase n=1 Tax=Rhizophora mucronata TaxID=61149 RepID=A0A2P2MJ26_RHIMU